MLSCIGLINLKSVKSYLSMFADDISIDFKSVKTYDNGKYVIKIIVTFSVSQICFFWGIIQITFLAQMNTDLVFLNQMNKDCASQNQKRMDHHLQG